MTLAVAPSPTSPGAISEQDFRSPQPDAGPTVFDVVDDARKPTEFTFPIPEGRLVLSVYGIVPPWFKPTVRALADLLWLEPNWDSYGARRVVSCHVEGAVKLLAEVMSNDSPAPSVGPTSRGGVILEWHRGGCDLEVETLAPSRFLVSFEDPVNGSESDQELTHNFDRLRDWIDRIS